MKKNLTTTLLIVMIISLTSISAQTFKKNFESQSQKYDRQNLLKSDDISTLDLLQALEFSGIKIHKFTFPEFDTIYKITFIIEEFKNFKLKEKTVLYSDKNYYRYKDYDSTYLDYLDQIKFVTKDENNGSRIFFKTYTVYSNKGDLLKNDTADNKAFYIWRDYVPLKWKLNQKTPLMLYGSSWFDKNIEQHRFCGAAILEPGEEQTEVLLTHSPHYYMVSYIISKP